MVRDASRPLSRIGFRRDVKLFLGILAGLLVTLIAVLLILLAGSMRRADEATLQRWEDMTELTASTIHDAAPYAPGELETRAEYLREKLGASHVLIESYGATITRGAKDEDSITMERRRPFGRVALTFDNAARRRQQRAFFLTSTVVILATLISCLLLFLYVPKIVTPIGQMLDQAKEVEVWSHEKDEANYLIETFKRSIDTLKTQEAELKRLHLLERTRANDLERVTTTLTRSLTSGLIALDTAGRIVQFNAAAHEMLATRAADVEGLTPTAALADESIATLLEDAFREQRSLSRHEIESEGSAGSVRIGLTTVPLRNELGEMFGMLALLLDLTPLRSLEHRVRDMQSLADLGEMSAGIAHEFRNSLSTILGYLKLARRSEIPEEASARLDGAEREAVELADAVRRLLAFARPIRPDLERVDLRSLAQQIVDRIRTDDDLVQFDISGDAIEVDADPSLLARAVENLIRNAAESVRIKGGGDVVITIAAEPVPTLTIRDTGVGIDPASAAKLFLPFHSEKSTGVGMGLPLAKKIILVHGGTVELTGRPGEGATARVTLPREMQNELRSAPPTVTL